MRHLKILGLLAVAAAAMMAFAASASATTVTSPTGTVTWGPIHAVNENGHSIIHNAEGTIECASTFELGIDSQGNNVTAIGDIDYLAFTNCTNGWSVSVNSTGELAIHHTSGYNGTITSNGTTTTSTLNLIFFHITCRYKTSNTHIGTVTGGNPATLHIEGTIPFHSGSGACGTEAVEWTGDYTTTGALYVDP